MSSSDNKKLSGLGAEIEKTLSKLLKEVSKANATDEDGKKYTLTDKMKVIDRALKLEAIKSKMEDNEGAFFSAGGTNDEDEAENE